MNELNEMTTIIDEVVNLLLTDFWPFVSIPIFVSILSVAFRVIGNIMSCRAPMGIVSSFSRDTYDSDEPILKEEKVVNQLNPVIEPDLPDPPVKVLSRYAFTITCPNCGASVSGDSKQCAYCDSYFIRQVNSRRL